MNIRDTRHSTRNHQHNHFLCYQPIVIQFRRASQAICN